MKSIYILRVNLNLAESIAQSLESNISAKNIILGNGSNEILEFISRSLLTVHLK